MITKEDIEKEKEIECSISKKEKPYIKIKSAKFECPSCGTIISVLQVEKKFREPSRCSCGRRGLFKVISKETIEAQDIIIRELESNFEYKVYIEGKKNVDKMKMLDVFSKIILTGEIYDEYKKKSVCGELVIFAKDIKELKEDKPNFLK